MAHMSFIFLQMLRFWSTRGCWWWQEIEGVLQSAESLFFMHPWNNSTAPHAKSRNDERISFRSFAIANNTPLNMTCRHWKKGLTVRPNDRPLLHMLLIIYQRRGCLRRRSFALRTKLHVQDTRRRYTPSIDVQVILRCSYPLNSLCLLSFWTLHRKQHINQANSKHVGPH